MLKKIFINPIIVALLLVPVLFGFNAHNAVAQNSNLAQNAQLKEAVKAVIKENPNLVLDVLKDNSELVLEIAKQGSEQRKRKIYAAKWRADLNEAVKIDLKGRPVRGNGKAPVTIVAYSDFTCPYCQQGTEIVSKVMATYKDKVRFVFKHMPLDGQGHAYARVASEFVVAAFMQDEAKAWQYYDQIFSQRETLLAEGDKFLQNTAKNLGFNLQKLIADSKSRNVKAIIDADIAEAETLGVQGTPYFLVNNLRVPGVIPEDLFGMAVDIALEGK